MRALDSVKTQFDGNLTAADYSNRLLMLQNEAKRIFAKQYNSRNYAGMRFDGDYWDYTPRELFVAGHRQTVTFYRGELAKRKNATQTRDPLPESFTGAFKTWFVLENQRPAQATLAMQAARHLWFVLERTGKSAAFSWYQLTNNDLREAEVLIASRVKKGSAATFCRRLRDFVSWGVVEGVLRPRLTWAPNTAAPLVDEASDESAVRRLDRLPHYRLLEILGEIYQRHAKDPRDRLIICAIGILLVAGFRLEELLSLPINCLQKEVDRYGRVRWFLRYWKRKGRGSDGKPQAAVRYLSPLGAELARACIAEIKKISAKARAQARRLEQSPGRVRIPWARNATTLSREQVARAFAIKPIGLSSMISQGSINLTPSARDYRKPGGQISYKTIDVERELWRRRKGSFSLIADGVTTQLLSDTLLIEFALTGNGFTTNPLLVNQLMGSAITTFLGGANHRSPSAFVRFGFDDQDADGEMDYRVRSHAFRHWLNTVANKAGMTAFQITLWMGRSSWRETMRYLHSSSEIAEADRVWIEEDKMGGQPVEAYQKLPSDDRPAYLDTIREAHRGNDGDCLLTLSRTNCTYGKLCEVCPNYVWPKEVSEVDLKRLEEHHGQVVTALKALRAVAGGGEVVQSRQIEICEQQERHLAQRIAGAAVMQTDGAGRCRE